MFSKASRFLVHAFASLFCISVTNTGSTSEVVGVVRNLTVKLIVDDETRRYVDKYGSFRLNVSWLPPYLGKRPSSYSIMITNFPRENNSTSDACPEESLYYTSQNPSQLSILLPQNQLLSDIPEMSIRPNCSYKIEVFANPRTKSTLKTDVIFTVPECVGDTCSCGNVRSKLPTPKVDIAIKENHTVVRWNVTSDVYVKSYVISYGVPILTSSSGLPVYNVTRVATISANTTVYAWDTVDIRKYGELENGQKVLVTAVDEHGCAGPDGTCIVLLPEGDNFVRMKLTWLIFVGIIIGCVLLGILKLSTICKEKYHYLFLPVSWRRVQPRVVPKCRSGWAESILLNRNVLYIEHNTEVRYDDDADELEVPYKSVKLLRELGEGQFGRVYLGHLGNNEKNLVAVKMSLRSDDPNENQTRQQLMEEIDIIKAAGPHKHLVRLIGYCTSPHRPLCIIFEYMEGGDLLMYLRSRKRNQRKHAVCVNEEVSERVHRPSISETLYTTISSGLSSVSTYASSINPPLRYIECYKVDELDNQAIITYANINGKHKEVNELPGSANGPVNRDLFIKFAIDIASGMEHLETKGITHRDLAARNILLTSDLTLKISDFGLSRNGIYVMSNVRKGVRHLPIRWMSPEALRERAFSCKSDVWSFGIVLWEIATLGTFPYPDIQDEHLLFHVIHNNGHPRQPDDVCHDIYETMQMCWYQNPDERPTFTQLLLRLRVLKGPLHAQCATCDPYYAMLTHVKNIK